MLRLLSFLVGLSSETRCLIDPDEIHRILLERVNTLDADTRRSRLRKQLDQLHWDLHPATPAALDSGDSAAIRIPAKWTNGFMSGI
jgi:hypothetical protein